MLLLFHNFYTVLHVLKLVNYIQIFKLKMFLLVMCLRYADGCHRVRLYCAATRTWQYGADGG